MCGGGRGNQLCNDPQFGAGTYTRETGVWRHLVDEVYAESAGGQVLNNTAAVAKRCAAVVRVADAHERYVAEGGAAKGDEQDELMQAGCHASAL